MTIQQQGNPNSVIVVLTGDEASAAQWISFAKKKAKFLSEQSRQTGGAPLVQRFDLANAIVIVTAVGNYKKVQIDGQQPCTIRMWSGLWDLRALPTTGTSISRPVSPTNLFPNLDSTHDYTPWGEFRSAQAIYKRLTDLPYAPQVTVAAEAETFARSAAYLASAKPGFPLCTNGEFLFSKQAVHRRVASSCMTGRMRKLWQSIVGLRFGADGRPPWQNDIGTKNVLSFPAALKIPGYSNVDVSFSNNVYDADACASLLFVGDTTTRSFTALHGSLGTTVASLEALDGNTRPDSFYPRTTWLHVDSKNNYSILGKTLRRIVAMPLDTTCGEYIRAKLEADDPPLSTREKEVLESYLFGLMGLQASLAPLGRAPNISDIPDPVGVLPSIFCVMENLTGVQDVTGGYAFDFIQGVFVTGTLCHGYMGKASDDGKYMAEIWAHADGPVTLAGLGFGFQKRPNGNITTYEHVYKAERDPDAVINPLDTPVNQERDRWTLTATNRKLITYRFFEDPVVNPTTWAAINVMRIFSDRGWDNTGFGNFGSGAGFVLERESTPLTRSLLGINATPVLPGYPGTAYTAPLPTGEIPFYVIGFEVGNEFYHKLVLDITDLTTPKIRLIRTNADTGAETELTPAPVFPMTATTEPPSPGPGPSFLVPHWTPLIPRNNSECIYCLENFSSGHPLFPPGRIYRYTPKDGLVLVSPDQVGFFFGSDQFDHESAYRRKYVSTISDNVSADYGIAIAHPIPTADVARFVWAGHE